MFFMQGRVLVDTNNVTVNGLSIEHTIFSEIITNGYHIPSGQPEERVIPLVATGAFVLQIRDVEPEPLEFNKLEKERDLTVCCLHS